MRVLNIYVSTYINPLRTGSYGVVIEESGKTRELSACYRSTTNYRIQLFGVVNALNSLSESCELTIYVDSQYIANGINKDWAKSWRRRNWRIKNGEKAKNADLWEILLNMTEKHNMDFVCLQRHNGQEYGYEYYKRCNELAIEAVKRG